MEERERERDLNIDESTEERRYRTFTFRGKPFRIQEGFPASAVGARVWDCSFILTKYFDEFLPAEFFRGKNTIELGSGVGYLGTILSRLGCSPLLLTDQKEMIPTLRANVLANDLPDTRVEELCWYVFIPPGVGGWIADCSCQGLFCRAPEPAVRADRLRGSAVLAGNVLSAHTDDDRSVQ
jgi:hypothetical protein